MLNILVMCHPQCSVIKSREGVTELFLFLSFFVNFLKDKHTVPYNQRAVEFDV